jgi:hypothetical protein
VIGPSLVEKIVAVHSALDRAGVRHAFGGALALAYYTDDVRATKDIDVNVFVQPTDAVRVLEALPPGVEWSAADVAAIKQNGQVRVWWGETPVDLFFDQHQIHADAARHAITVPFAGHEISILSSTELAVFKMMFSRSKDWVDIEAMIDAGSLDVSAAGAAFARIMGDNDVALDRLHELEQAQGKASPEPRFDP